MSQPANFQASAMLSKFSAPQNRRGRQTDRKYKERRERFDILMAAFAIIVAFRPELFFSTMAILGIRYSGSENSSIFLGFIGISSAILYILVIKRVLSERFLELRGVIIVLFPAILVSLYLVDTALYRTEASSYGHFLLTLVFASPAAVAGMIFTDRDIRAKHAYALEPAMVIMSAGLMFSVLATLQGSAIDRSVGGASYQTASYIGALAFNLNLFYSLQGRSGDRPFYTKSKIYGVLCWLLLPAQVISVLLSGGRGGFVLVVVSIAVQSVFSLQSGHASRAIARVFGICVVLVMSATWAVPLLLARADLARIIDRVFSYLGDDGIDWSGSSGRDNVYARAVGAVDESSVFGYGFFSWGSPSYPHNIFLEWLLNGGVIYLAFWILTVGVLVLRGVRLARKDQTVLIVCMIGLYPMVYLQFSGSYWTAGVFWFVLAFLFCVNSEESRIKPSQV